MIRITIADDHPLVREGIKRVVRNEIDIDVIGEASDGQQLLSLLNEEMPDLAITDMMMPGKSGLDLVKDITSWYPDLPVLVLSIHSADRFALRSLKAGARGYLCKSGISDELVKAIRKIVNQKRRYITDEVAEQLANQINHQGDSPMHNALSDREFEVLCMIAQGKDIASIADKLSLSTHTVHTYRTRIKEKMNLKSNVEMTRYALKNGLIN
jgi:DNA-binding NarL/FixJ family response regulator